MKHEFVYFEQERLFYLRTWGPSSVSGFRRYFLEQLEDPRLAAGFRILADHRLLDFVARGSTGVRQLTEVLKPYSRLLQGVRIASVVNSSLQFGLTRMWEALSEVADVPLDHFVTRDLREAAEHLGLGDELLAKVEALPPPPLATDLAEPTVAPQDAPSNNT